MLLRMDLYRGTLKGVRFFSCFTKRTMVSIQEWVVRNIHTSPHATTHEKFPRHNRRYQRRRFHSPKNAPPPPPPQKGIPPLLSPVPSISHVGGDKRGVRVFPLGGFEQVGRNCFVVEVDGALYIIDLGLQFPDEDMLGIDYLIPDISSLRGRERDIQGVIFTHGHLDHIGAAQHLLPALQFPSCFGTKLTMAFVRKRLDEDGITAKARLNVVPYRQRVRLGKVEIEFLRVTHSIPDSAAVALHTPYGTILHTGDFKFDLTPMNEPPADFKGFSELAQKGGLAITEDSTNAPNPGNRKSEREIGDTIRSLIQ